MAKAIVEGRPVEGKSCPEKSDESWCSGTRPAHRSACGRNLEPMFGRFPLPRQTTSPDAGPADRTRSHRGRVEPPTRRPHSGRRPPARHLALGDAEARPPVRDRSG
jgi:hypothetical protein